ncbi:MAG: hypothetical protein Q7S27_00220 [Nanoarchaeota archaeon]|nr:hypothetical protein [Nanoarchaeota archaeon]
MKRPRGFLTSMSPDEILKYKNKLYGKDITRGELQKKDPGLYHKMAEICLLSQIKTIRNVGFCLTFREWYEYGIENGYNERNVTSLIKSEDKDERSWYYRGSNMEYRGDGVGKEKWLKKFPFPKKFRKKNYWNNFENFKREMLGAIRENGGEFPTSRKLKEMGKNSLSLAISKNYGGICNVKEIIGYRSKNEELKTGLENVLRKYSEGGNNV